MARHAVLLSTHTKHTRHAHVSAPESMQHTQTHRHICLAFVIVSDANCDCDGDCRNSISIVCLDYAVVLSNEKTSSRAE